MTFSDTTNKNGLIQQCEMNLFGDAPFGKISGDSSRLAIFTNYLNEALYRYAYFALMSDYVWEFDDRNYTDLPIATTAITLNQQDYAISSEHMIITGVEIKDTSGNWNALNEIDERYFVENNISISNYMSTPTGFPTQYTKVANSIFLFPIPNFTQAASLKVRFKRAPVVFQSTDTTDVQGFSDIQVNYLSDYASWKYASNRSMPMTNRLQQQVLDWEERKIPDLYSKRSAEHSKIIRSTYKTSR